MREYYEKRHICARLLQLYSSGIRTRRRSDNWGVEAQCGEINIRRLTSPEKSNPEFDRGGAKFHDTVEGISAQGQPFKLVFQDILDGVPHPATGSPDYDSIAFTRFGNTIDEIRFRQGKAVQIAHILIVPGKTVTIITGGMTADNQPFYHVGVYDRQ
jgi:hypothetical protein